MVSESILLSKVTHCNGCTYDNGEEPDICQSCTVNDTGKQSDRKSFASYLEAECEKIGSEPN